MSIYIILAVLWILLCVSIGLYINGFGLTGRRHYRIGFLSIGLSYVIGVSLLIAAIVLYS